MRTYTFWIIIFVFCIVGYSLEQFLRKKLNMPKKGLWGYNKHVNSLHKKLEIGLIFVYLITSFIYIFKFESANIAYVIFTYLGVSWILRAWMEWKYDRESKEYVISLFGLFSFILLILTMFYFVPPASY
ncbi:DUF4181 domain-containing protein [Bacillus luti]|uniref:DUF4181 domain-containing protein n=1 Tax=Bacillus luti TaxID=2026191 RepID=UPI003D049488